MAIWVKISLETVTFGTKSQVFPNALKNLQDKNIIYGWLKLWIIVIYALEEGRYLDTIHKKNSFSHISTLYQSLDYVSEFVTHKLRLIKII